MQITLYWKDLEIIEVRKIKENKYVSTLSIENITKAEEDGFPVALIQNVKLIDNKMPNIILDRIPSAEYLSSVLKDTENVEKSILEYINKTRCKRVTDYITLVAK